RVWNGIRTDALGFTDEHEFQAPSANRVLLDGAVQRAEEYFTELLEGFTDSYRFLTGIKEEIVADGGPLSAFADLRVRVMFRLTNQYAVVQDVLAVPKYLSSGVARSYGLDVLARPFALDRTRPVAWPLAVEERRALEHLDIPHFTVGTDRVAVQAGERVIGD